MLVEFETVRIDLKEDYDQDVAVSNADLTGGSKIAPFFNQKDYLAPTTIDMRAKKIKSFWAGHVWLNSQKLECVYVMNDEFLTSPNLIISYQEFLALYEKINAIEVKTWQQILEPS